MQSSLVNRNIILSTGRTGVRLEPEIWDAFEEICRRERLSKGDIVARAEIAHPSGSRTSAICTYLFQYFRSAASVAELPQAAE